MPVNFFINYRLILAFLQLASGLYQLGLQAEDFQGAYIADLWTEHQIKLQIPPPGLIIGEALLRIIDQPDFPIWEDPIFLENTVKLANSRLTSRLINLVEDDAPRRQGRSIGSVVRFATATISRVPSIVSMASAASGNALPRLFQGAMAPSMASDLVPQMARIFFEFFFKFLKNVNGRC